MQQFNLDKWLQDKSRKIVTRSGHNVRILCTDQRGNMPIVALVEFETLDGVQLFYHDGKNESRREYDLFFADEEKLNSIIDELKSYLEKTPKEQVEKDWKEIQDWYTQHFTNEKHNKEEKLTEFEKELQIIISDASHWTSDDGSISTYCQFGDKEIKKISGQLLDLARKEIEKENSGFKPKFTYNEKDYSELGNKLIEFRNNTPLFSVSYRDGEGRKIILHYEKEILNLARKELEKSIEDGAIEFAKSYMEDVDPLFEKVQESEELWKWKMSCLRGINKAYKQGKQDALKDFPKWKKCDDNLPYSHIGGLNERYLIKNGYCIKISDLETLPKEE
jgi:hypothetical protein